MSPKWAVAKPVAGRLYMFNFLLYHILDQHSCVRIIIWRGINTLAIEAWFAFERFSFCVNPKILRAIFV